jgi:hypothetical protein
MANSAHEDNDPIREGGFKAISIIMSRLVSHSGDTMYPPTFYTNIHAEQEPTHPHRLCP